MVQDNWNKIEVPLLVVQSGQEIMLKGNGRTEFLVVDLVMEMMGKLLNILKLGVY